MDERKLEKTLKALANRRRLTILRYLKKRGEASVGEIAGAINLSFKSTSRHLAVLTANDILDKEQKRLNVFYRLAANQKPPTRTTISSL
jgi:DNA-binding transcriptional ArsR family regulator